MNFLEIPDTTHSWSAFGSAVAARRKELGLTQEQLALRIGAVPSWVSQVESGTKPSTKRANALEFVLGPEVRRARPDVEHDHEAASDILAVAFPLLWRARVDMLKSLGVAAGKETQRRRRLHELSSDLDSAATSHPLSAGYTAHGDLLALHTLSANGPDWLNCVVLAEVACMKVDAPFHTGVNRDSRRLEPIDVIAADLNVPAEKAKAMVQAIERFNRDRHRPKSQELPSLGGAVGRVQAHASGPDGHQLELLIGHDPAGWFGFGVAAGRWLLSGAPDMTAQPDDALHSYGIGLAGGGASAAAGSTRGAALGALAEVLLPGVGIVLGSVVGASLGTWAAGRMRTRGVAAQPVGSFAPAPGADVLADQAESLGRHWVTVEACKLAALYAAIPDAIVGIPEAGLPPAPAAAQYLSEVAASLTRAAEEEVAMSGIRDHDENPRLRELVGSADSLLAASKILLSSTGRR